MLLVQRGECIVIFSPWCSSASVLQGGAWRFYLGSFWDQRNILLTDVEGKPVWVSSPLGKDMKHVRSYICAFGHVHKISWGSYKSKNSLRSCSDCLRKLIILHCITVTVGFIHWSDWPGNIAFVGAGLLCSWNLCWKNYGLDLFTSVFARFWGPLVQLLYHFTDM